MCGLWFNESNSECGTMIGGTSAQQCVGICSNVKWRPKGCNADRRKDTPDQSYNLRHD